jgi:hypothetical protein
MNTDRLFMDKNNSGFRRDTRKGQTGLRISGIVVFLFVFGASWLHAERTVITYRAKESTTDKRYDYDTSVLRLALEKTRSTYGDYEMVASPKMNYARTHVELTQKVHTNFFAKLSYEDRLVNGTDLAFVPFPVDLGIVGYRAFFVSSKISNRVGRVKRLKDLQRFSLGQGNGWADNAILKEAGFTVKEIPSYESLFKMVAINRFDLLPRGINELMDEFKAHEHLPGLTYDTTLCLAYPFPRFFFTRKSNQLAIQRITEGLLTAYEDGSLRRLWEQHYRKSIDFIKLNERRIIRIDNPFISGLAFDYERYCVDPLSLTPKPPKAP